MNQIYGSSWFNAEYKDVLTLKHNWLSHDICIALLKSKYNFNICHTRLDQIKKYEIKGEGYVTGGKVFLNKTVSQSCPRGIGFYDFSAEKVTWENSTITSHGCVIYDKTMNNSLLAMIDFGSNQSSSFGDFTLEWKHGPMFSIEVSFKDIIYNAIQNRR